MLFHKLSLHSNNFEGILFILKCINVEASLKFRPHIEQKAVLELLSNEGVRSSETYRGMKSQYGDRCSNQNRVFK